MRLLKTSSMVLVLGTLTASAVAAEYDRFGKGALSIGATPPGVSTAGGYVYARQYVQPAPVVAAAPATDGRRAFSAEPSTAPPVANAPANDGRRTFSVEPSTTGPAAPAVGVMRAPLRSSPEYNKFGKGANSIGSQPPGVR
jgi:hypothetical protein